MKNNRYTRIRNLFVLPSILGMSIFLGIPYAYIILRSFTSNNLTELSFENYKDVLKNSSFVLANKNTCIFMILALSIMIILAIFLSYIIFEFVKNRKLLKIIILIPTLLPISTLIVVWNFIFDKFGILNKYIYPGGGGIDWIDSKYALIVLIFGFLWRNIGFSIILLLTGMETVPKEILESGQIDGVSFWKKLYYIVLPSIDEYFIFIIIFGMANALKIHRDIYLLAGEYPHKSIYMVQNLLNSWFINLQIDKLSAGAVIELIVLLIPILFMFRMIEVKLHK